MEQNKPGSREETLFVEIGDTIVIDKGQVSIKIGLPSFKREKAENGSELNKVEYSLDRRQRIKCTVTAPRRYIKRI